jgi:hypothetical protein
LKHALGAWGAGLLASAPKPPADQGFVLGIERLAKRAERRFEMDGLGIEQPLDLAPADSDSSQVPECLRGSFVREVGGQVECLLAHRRGVFASLIETDPLVERPMHGPAARATEPHTLQLDRPEVAGDEAPRAAPATPHAPATVGTQHRACEECLLDLSNGTPQRARECPS